MVEETELETLIDAATLCPLPPLPIPDHATRFRQWSVGCGVVLCAIVIILSTTWALMYMQAVPSRLAMALVLVVSGEAVIALICLVGLHGDSDSVILRDPSQPMPDDVVSALRIAGPLPSRNIEDEQRGSFCVRCLVWRPVSTPQCCAKRSRHLLAGLCEHTGHGAHHCSICQRCVAEFSHHCGFFGRCIAGRGRRGNYKYFRTIIIDGHAAFLSFIAVLAVHASYVYSIDILNILLPAAFVLYIAYWLITGGGMLLFSLWRFGASRHCPHLACGTEIRLPPTPVVVAYLACCPGCALPISC